MIETTYVRLAQAAAMLDTDADTLLIAAAEGRIQLHWLLNALMWAKRGCRESVEWGVGWCWNGVDEGFRNFKFIPLSQADAADLLKKDVAEWDECSRLSIADADGTYWVGANDEGGLSKPGDHEWKIIKPSMVFMRLADVEAIKAAHATPAPDTITDAPPRRPVPRDNSLICTLAALLSVWPGGAIPSGKDLEKAAQSLGLTLSDDTIRKALKAAQEAAPSLPLPK